MGQGQLMCACEGVTPLPKRGQDVQETISVGGMSKQRSEGLLVKAHGMRTIAGVEAASEMNPASEYAS